MEKIFIDPMVIRGIIAMVMLTRDASRWLSASEKLPYAKIVFSPVKIRSSNWIKLMFKISAGLEKGVRIMKHPI